MEIKLHRGPRERFGVYEPALMSETKSLCIDLIEHDPEFTARIDEPDRRMVAAIVRTFTAGSSCPPVSVYNVDGRFKLVDGRARVLAAKQTGRREIFATILTGTKTDAMLAAAAANRRPEQPRSPAEVQAAARLSLAAAPQWQTREHAQHVGCSENEIERAREPAPPRGDAP